MARELTWLRLSELENAVDNLEMVDYFLENIQSEIKWKWAVIALHQALYGFAICALSGFVPKEVTKPSKKHLDGELISIWKAIDLVKEPPTTPYEFYEPLVLSSDEEWAIKKIVDDFRNEFEHFAPKLLSIEVSGMPMIFSKVLRVIRFLALESKRVNSSIGDEKRVRSAIEKIKSWLKVQQLDETNY